MKNTFFKTIALFAFGLLFDSCMMMHPMGMGAGMNHAQHADAYTDPVCGMQVDPNTALTFNYGGDTYYFDSEEHLKTFQKNPQQFAKKRDHNMDMSNGLIWGGVGMGALMVVMMAVFLL